MNAAQTIEIENASEADLKRIHFPLGLLGFEGVKDFELLTQPHEAPFCWLQSASDPNLAFVVVSPFEFLPNYEPDIAPSDSDFLGITSAADALVFSIVTLRGRERATANLKGPIVVNRFTSRAKQVVLTNAASYPLQHPLPLTEP